MHRKNLE